MLMLRDQVDVHGIARLMEPMDEVTALEIRPQEISIIKRGLSTSCG